MYRYVYIYIDTLIYSVLLSIHHEYFYMYLYIHQCKCILIYMYACMHIHAYIHMYILIYIIDMSIYVYMSIYMGNSLWYRCICHLYIIKSIKKSKLLWMGVPFRHYPRCGLMGCSALSTPGKHCWNFGAMSGLFPLIVVLFFVFANNFLFQYNLLSSTRM